MFKEQKRMGVTGGPFGIRVGCVLAGNGAAGVPCCPLVSLGLKGLGWFGDPFGFKGTGVT